MKIFYDANPGDGGDAGGDVDIPVVDQENQDMIDEILDFAGDVTPENKEAKTAGDVDPADLIQTKDKGEESEPEPEPEPEPELEPAEETKIDPEPKPESGPAKIKLTEELKKSLNLGDDFEVGQEIELVAGGTEEESKSSEPLTDREQALINEINRLSALSGQQPQVQTQTQSQQSQEPEQSKQDDPALSFDIADDENFDEFLSSAEGLNKFGSELAGRTSQMIIQTIIPHLRSLIPQYLEISTSTQRFFESNQDLAGAKNYFGQVLNQIRQEKPNLGLNQLLEEAGKETRKRLGMPGKQHQAKSVPRPAVPGPNKVQRRKPAEPVVPKPSGNEQEQQIEELVEYATF